MKNININNKIAALFGLIASVAATSAIATDLPSRTNVPFPSTREYVDLYQPQFHVGGYIGSRVADNAYWNNSARLGVVAGWQPFSYMRLEGAYEYGWNNTRWSRNSNTLFMNAVAQYPVGLSFTPYVLAGTGYRWAVRDSTVWNIGGGIRYNLTQNVEADLRYRYVSDYNMRNHENVISLGLNYRF